MQRVHSCTSALGLLSLAAAGCYASHGRDALPVERPAGTCEAIEDWALEEPNASFEQALRFESGFLLGGGMPADRATTAWSITDRGAVRWRARASETRSGRVGLAEGGFWVAAAPGRQLELVRFDPTGSETARATVAREDEADIVSVVADGDAVYVVAASSEFSRVPDVLLARFDGDAELEWVRTYGDPGRMREERIRRAFVDAAGRLVVVTQRWIDGGHGPPWIFAVDTMGEVAWEHLGDVEYDRGSSWVVVPLDDGLVVAGSLIGTSSRASGRVFRLDTEGRLLWDRNLDDGSGRQQVISGGYATRDGGFLLAGYSANETAGAVWRLDADGSLRWSETPGRVGGMTTAFTHAAPFRDGHLLAAPHQPPDSEDRTWVFIRTDAAGQLVWRFDRPGTGHPRLTDLLRTVDGNALVTGVWSTDDERTALALQLGERCTE